MKDLGPSTMSGNGKASSSADEESQRKGQTTKNGTSRSNDVIKNATKMNSKASEVEGEENENGLSARNPSPEAPVLLPSSGTVRLSEPGAWGIHPTRRDGDDETSSDSSTLSHGRHIDEEAGETTNTTSAHDMTTNGDDEILINAELVDEDRDRMLVDAEMWDSDEEAKAKQVRRRMQRTFRIALLVMIIVLVISLSLTLPGNRNGSSSTANTQELADASSSPTRSLIPSQSPSYLPSMKPSSVPSQAPTTLIWQELQHLEGLMIEPAPGIILRGGEQFGMTVHASDIIDTPLGNRTGKEVLLVGSYADETEYVAPAGLFFATSSSAIFLCGGQDALAEDFCTLQTILPSISRASATSLTGNFFLVTKRDGIADLFDLSDVDSFNMTHAPDPLVADFPVSSLKNSAVVAEGGAQLITTNLQSQQTLTIGRPAQNESLGVISESVTYVNDVFWNFYSMALGGNTLITLQGVRDNYPWKGCAFATCGIFNYDRYSIIREEIFDTSINSLPPFEAGDGTSPFSYQGLAANEDASIVAVSSGNFLDLAENRLQFQVNIFQFTNSTEWEPMGSTIFGPSEGDYFGEALVLNTEGNFLAVGAPSDGTQGTDSGRVYSFVWDGEDWVPFGDPLEGAPSSRFGSSLDVSSDGGLLFVGAPGSDVNGQNSGEVVVFKLSGV